MIRGRSGAAIMDFVFVGCTILFFGLGIVYLKVCERLE